MKKEKASPNRRVQQSPTFKTQPSITMFNNTYNSPTNHHRNHLQQSPFFSPTHSSKNLSLTNEKYFKPKTPVASSQKKLIKSASNTGILKANQNHLNKVQTVG